MSDGGIEITEHAGGLTAIMDGPVVEYVTKITADVLAAAVAGAPVDTGELAASLGMQVTTDATGVVGLVGVRDGANQRSVGDATNHEVMLFEEHGDGNSPATHFMSDALNQAKR